MRGKVAAIKSAPLGRRITPACAGKRCPQNTAFRRRWDHPRVCGEKWPPSKAHRLGGGSPPRVRGKGIQPCYQRVRMRITPACAGKSDRPGGKYAGNWDHPRVCGEKWCTDLGDGCDWGSPPRMRGKDVRQELQHSGRGIIPACAGKSWSRRAESRKKRDHPRVCGEKTFAVWENVPGAGSPPRMRGKVKPVLWAARVAGITPAYAGKSVRRENSSS